MDALFAKLGLACRHGVKHLFKCAKSWSTGKLRCQLGHRSSMMTLRKLVQTLRLHIGKPGSAFMVYVSLGACVMHI